MESSQTIPQQCAVGIPVFRESKQKTSIVAPVRQVEMVTFNEVPQRFGHGPFYTRQEDLRREKWAKIAALTRIYLRQSEVIPFSHMDLARDAPYPPISMAREGSIISSRLK